MTDTINYITKNDIKSLFSKSFKTKLSKVMGNDSKIALDKIADQLMHSKTAKDNLYEMVKILIQRQRLPLPKVIILLMENTETMESR